jgi:hypothetical protein
MTRRNDMAVTQAQNPVVADPIRAAMEAIASGQDAAEAVYGKGVKGFEGAGVNVSEPEMESDETPAENESAPEDTVQVNEDEIMSPKSGKANAKAEASESKPTTTEEVFVKTPDGKRQAVKIDYENKDSIKQAFLKAAGFPLLNNKLSTVSKKYATLETEHKALKADMDKLEDIYSKSGVEGLINQLGRQEDLEKLIEARIKQREYLGSLTPDERYKHDMKTQAELANKRVSDTEAKYQKMLSDIEAKEESAALRSMESRLHPAFDRYRFAGKLGNEAAEARFDKAVWRDATEALAQYPEDVEITQAMIDKEFRLAAQEYSSTMKQQAEKTVVKTLDTKKANAAKSAQMVAKKGIVSEDKDKFINSIKSGNLMDAFAAMSSGKVRL